MDNNLESSDSIIEEIEIEFNQPPNQQTLHLYQIPLRPNFREYPIPSTINYYPESNQLSMSCALDVHDNFDPDHEYNEITQMQFVGNQVHHFSKKSNFAVGTFLNKKLIIQPISEIYLIKPDFSYINARFEAEITPFEKLDNETLTITSLTGPNFTYNYIPYVPTTAERFSPLTAAQLPFDVPPERYKNLFTTTSNSLSKLAQMIQNRPDLRSKCELLLRDQRIISFEQAKRLTKCSNEADLSLNLAQFSVQILGNFVIQSRFAVPEGIQRAREFVLWYMSIGGSGSFDGFEEVKKEQILANLKLICDEKRGIIVDRKMIKDVTQLATQDLSKVFELDGMIQPFGDEWQFGFQPDYGYVLGHLEEIAEKGFQEAESILNEVKIGAEILKEKQQDSKKRIMKIIREQ